MIPRNACIALSAVFAATLAVGSASAQDAPIARNSVDSAPPVATQPSASAQTPKPAQTLASTQPVASSTSAVSAAGPGSNSGDPTADQIANWIHADASPVQPLDPRESSLGDFSAPRRMHGEVGFEVSNRGYGGYGAVSMPIGQASELDVAVAGEHVRTPWGSANPKSLSIGLYLDGSDVARFISRDKCHVPRYGVRLPDDPQVQADGSCIKTDKSEQGE